MALTVTSRGTGTHNTGATTLVPGGRSGTLAVNSLGVLCMALDNAGASGSTLIAPDTWTDAKSNVWTLRLNALYDNGVASTGVEMAIYTAPISTQLLTTDAGTMTWKTGVSPVAKAWTWYEVIPSNGITPAYLANVSIAGATAANASVGTTVNVNVGDATIAGYFSENVAAVTGDSDGTNGNWVGAAGTSGSIDTATVGTTTSGVRIATANKVQITAASAQTWDCTVSSQDRIAGLITVREVVTKLVQPSAAAITIGTATPTVVALSNVLVQPAAAAITVGTATPTVTTHRLVQPAAAAIAISGAAHHVGDVWVILPAAAAVAVAGATPAVGTPVSVAPSAAAVSVGTATPAVVGENWPKAQPAAAAVTVAGATPAVGTPVSMAPAATAVAISGATPAVLLPIAVAPGAVAVAVAGATPTIATPVLLQPSVVAVAIAGATPTVVAGANQSVLPAAAAIAIGTATPAIVAQNYQSIQLTAAAVLLTAFAPTVLVTEHIFVTPPPATLVMAMVAPTVTVAGGDQLVTPGPLGLTLTGYPPVVTVTGGTPTPSGGGRRRRPEPPIDILADDEEILMILAA